MLAIRLTRGGAKKRPFYHVVVAEKLRPRDGRFIEQLGYFNPLTENQAMRLNLNQERIEYWLSQGAQASERVTSLIKEYKNIKQEPASVQPASKAKKSELKEKTETDSTEG